MSKSEGENPTTPIHRRPAVLQLLLIALTAEMGYAALNISTMPVYLSAERQFGEAWIAFILMAFLLSEAVFKGPMGHLADRVGRKKLLIVAPILTATTSLLSLYVPTTHDTGEVIAFVLLRVLDGIGAAMLWPAAFAAMGDLVQDHERQQGMSLLNMCYLVGVALALPLGGIAEDLAGTKSAGLYVSMALFLLVLLAVLRFNPPARASEHAPAESFSIAEFVRSARRIPSYLLLAVVLFVGIGFPMPIVKLFAADEFGLSGAAFGALVFPAALAMALLSVPMSRWGDRLGRTRAIHVGLFLCSAGLALLSLGAFFAAFRFPWVVALGAIPVGLGFLLTIPAWLASVSDLDPAKRGGNLGAVMTAQGVGAILGMPLGGLLYERVPPVGVQLGLGTSFGHYSPFLACALCVTLGWLLSLRLFR